MARPNQPASEREKQMDDFVAYFRDVPVQKYAAMYVGITEQTAIDWLKKYPEFFNRVNQARADWVKKKAIKAKAEFALERLEHEVWKERKETDTNIHLPKPIMDVTNALRSNNGNQED